MAGKVAKTALLAALLGLLLAGCSAGQGDLMGVWFHRGHGSAWGNQFYMHLQPTQIRLARYIPEGSSELVTVENIPITEEQWETVKNAVEQLPLEKARTRLWEKQKVDGSQFRELTLLRGKKETTYWWPDTPEAQALEQLLEQLLAESLGKQDN